MSVRQFVAARLRARQEEAEPTPAIWIRTTKGRPRRRQEIPCLLWGHTPGGQAVITRVRRHRTITEVVEVKNLRA